MQCWKPREPPFNGKVCLPLDANHLDIWTSAITNPNPSATLFQPPDVEEFWKLKDKYRAGRRGGTKFASESLKPDTTNTSESGSPTFQSNVTLRIDKNAIKEVITSPEKPANSSTRCTSPITEYPPNEWNRAGLEAFLKYCTEKYQDQYYINSYGMLSIERLGIDVYKAAIVDDTLRRDLMEDLKALSIKKGMLRRWLTDFEAWYAIIREFKSSEDI
jgi:hypothetical protein